MLATFSYTKMASVLRRTSRTLYRFSSNIRVPPLRPYALNMDDDGDMSSMKTTVNILNQDQESGIFFDGFSQIGFRLSSGIRVMGPCVAFAKSLLHWNIRGVADLNEDSFSLFTILEPKIDILVVGVGEKENLAKIDHRVIRYLRSKRINLELLQTDQALATFNFLNSEKRYVAGAFIPPSYLEFAEDDEDISGITGRDMDEVGDFMGPVPDGPAEFENLLTGEKLHLVGKAMAEVITGKGKEPTKPSKKDEEKYTH